MNNTAFSARPLESGCEKRALSADGAPFGLFPDMWQRLCRSLFHERFSSLSECSQ
jgi:hypothetical protein